MALDSDQNRWRQAIDLAEQHLVAARLVAAGAAQRFRQQAST